MSSALVRRSTYGRSICCSSTTCSGRRRSPYRLSSSGRRASPKASSSKKDIRPRSSGTSFCTGVPVSNVQCGTCSARSDAANLVRGFLSRCASSTIRYCHGMAEIAASSAVSPSGAVMSTWYRRQPVRRWRASVWCSSFASSEWRASAGPVSTTPLREVQART